MNDLRWICVDDEVRRLGHTSKPVAPPPVWQHPAGIIVPAGFPNPTTTGWAAAGVDESELVLSNNNWQFRAADSGSQSEPAIISNRKWAGQDVRVYSDAHDITFRNCDFQSPGDWSVYLEPGATRIRFEYCTFHADSMEDDVPIAGSDRTSGLWSAGATHWTVDHCHFYWLTGGIYSNGEYATLTNNYFADFTYWSEDFYPPNGDHTNATGPAGGTSSHQVYSHNTFLMIRASNQEVFPQTSCINFAQDDPAPYTDMTVNHNFFVGNQGGHMILGYEPGKGGAPGNTFRVTNNVHSSWGTSSPPRAGYHGQPTWNQAPANNVWSNNVWVDETNVEMGELAPVTT